MHTHSPLMQFYTCLVQIKNFFGTHFPTSTSRRSCSRLSPTTIFLGIIDNTMELPPHSPQTSPLQVSSLAMRPPNPDSPLQQTLPPPPTATYKGKIRSKSTRPMASAPPLTKRKDPPTTPLSEPPPKNPKTSASIRHGVGIFTSIPQAKSPSSSKK